MPAIRTVLPVVKDVLDSQISLCRGLVMRQPPPRELNPDFKSEAMRTIDLNPSSLRKIITQKSVLASDMFDLLFDQIFAELMDIES